MTVRIVALAKDLDRSGFTSGVAALDDWFKTRASQDEKRNIARVFVAVDNNLGVVGFYSLSTYTLAIDDMPPDHAKKLPRYDQIPAALIGRLARDIRMKGKDLGALLLGDAVRRIIAANRSLAVHAIVVDAKDDKAAAFYSSFGFLAFPLHPRRLFLPMQVAESAFVRSDISNLP